MRCFGKGALVLAAVTLTAPACSPGSERASSTTSSTAAVSTSTAASPVTTGGIMATTPTATPTTQAAAGTAAAGGARCAAAALALSVNDLGAAAGTAFRALVFKNISAVACTMQGYPGVSFVDGRGKQVGIPALRFPGTGALVTVAPGATAAALLAYHDVYVSTFPGCQPTAAAAIRVYPPNETASLSVATHLIVCANPTATGAADISPVTTPANLRP